MKIFILFVFFYSGLSYAYVEDKESVFLEDIKAVCRSLDFISAIDKNGEFDVSSTYKSSMVDRGYYYGIKGGCKAGSERLYIYRTDYYTPVNMAGHTFDTSRQAVSLYITPTKATELVENSISVCPQLERYKDYKNDRSLNRENINREDIIINVDRLEIDIQVRGEGKFTAVYAAHSWRSKSEEKVVLGANKYYFHILEKEFRYNLLSELKMECSLP